MLNADAVTRLEADIAVGLSEQVGLPLPPENFDCGSGALILPPGNVVTCALTDPNTNEVWDAEVTIYGGDPIRFDVKVASEPRGS